MQSVSRPVTTNNLLRQCTSNRSQVSNQDYNVHSQEKIENDMSQLLSEDLIRQAVLCSR